MNMGTSSPQFGSQEKYISAGRQTECRRRLRMDFGPRKKNYARIGCGCLEWSESKRSGYREGLDPNRVQSQTSAIVASPSNELSIRLCIPKSSPVSTILRNQRFRLNTKSPNRRKCRANGSIRASRGARECPSH